MLPDPGLHRGRRGRRLNRNRGRTILPPGDPQFVHALAAARDAAAKAGYARWPRSQHRDKAESAVAEAVLRAARAHRPARGPFAPFAASYVRQALREIAAKLQRTRRRKPEPRSFDGAGVSSRSLDTPPIPDEALLGLTPNQRAVVKARYELRRSFREIGDEHGVTRQAAQRTHKRALARLRKRSGESPRRDG